MSGTLKLGATGGQILFSTSGTSGLGMPATGYGSLYYGTDKQLRIQNDVGTITILGAGGTGSGTSGTSGNSGTSGANGSSGSSGVSGSSGSSGVSGSSGTSGLNGSSGSSGVSGSSGSSGVSGSSGTSGLNGSSGSSGSSGISGATGATGSGATINNNANDRVITGSATPGELNGETDLTFDGSSLSVQNIKIGYGGADIESITVGKDTFSLDKSVVIGFEAGGSAAGGANDSVIIGYRAGYTGGHANSVLIGIRAHDFATANEVIAIGDDCMGTAKANNQMLAIGQGAMGGASGSVDCIGIGRQTFNFINNATGAIALGNEAGKNSTSINNTILLGDFCFYAGSTASNSYLAGEETAFALGTTTNNVMIGHKILPSATGAVQDNVYIGSGIMTNGTGGNYNTGVGKESLKGSSSNFFGDKNQAFGYQSGFSLFGNTSLNTFVGYAAGYLITSGQKNVILGSDDVGTVGITGGSNNVIIGNNLTVGNVSSHIILGDGNGTTRLQFNNTGQLSLTGPTVSASVSNTVTNKIAITVNGTLYYLLASTSGA